MGGLATITPTFSGSPIEGDKFTGGCITPEFLGADSLVTGGGGTGGERSKKDAQRAPGALILPLGGYHRVTTAAKNTNVKER